MQGFFFYVIIYDVIKYDVIFYDDITNDVMEYAMKINKNVTIDEDIFRRITETAEGNFSRRLEDLLRKGLDSEIEPESTNIETLTAYAERTHAIAQVLLKRSLELKKRKAEAQAHRD